MAHEDEEYSIDPRTGKRHKNLKGMDPQAIKAFSKKAPSIEELRRAVEEDPDSAGFLDLTKALIYSLVTSKPLCQRKRLTI